MACTCAVFLTILYGTSPCRGSGGPLCSKQNMCLGNLQQLNNDKISTLFWTNFKLLIYKRIVGYIFLVSDETKINYFQFYDDITAGCSLNL